MTRTQPESRIVNAILRRLNAAPATHARKTHGSRYSSGWPDIVGCSAGRMFAIEVKQPGKRATARQEYELEQWRLAGALVGVATTVPEADEIVWPMMVTLAPADQLRPGGPVGMRPVALEPGERLVRHAAEMRRAEDRG